MRRFFCIPPKARLSEALQTLPARLFFWPIFFIGDRWNSQPLP